MSRTPNILTFYNSTVSNMVDGPSYYGFSSGIFTVGYFIKNFSGRIYVEASLVKYPSENDWFSVKINNYLYNQYDNETRSEIFNLKCNAIKIRIRVDQAYIPSSTPTGDIQHAYVLI